MKRRTILSAVLALSVAFVTQLPAQTVHLICSIDEMTNLAPASKKDFEILNGCLHRLAQDYAGMEYRVHKVGFSNEAIISFLNGFQCGPDDAVIFFFTGHGFQNENRPVRWPVVSYCPAGATREDIPQCTIPLDYIHEALISKGPRMSITLGSNCNNRVGTQENEGSFPFEKKPSANAQNVNGPPGLLLAFQGHIIASSASPGQLAWTDTENGSFFVNSLVEVLNNTFNIPIATSWTNVLQKVKEKVQKTPDAKGQRPQFLVKADNKIIFSEGKDVYDQTQSYEDYSEYEDLETDGYEFVEDWEIDESWEEAYSAEEELEFALMDMGLILLTALQSDGDISESEQEKLINYYSDVLIDYGYLNDYDRTDVYRETYSFFDELVDALQEVEKMGVLEEFVTETLIEFQEYNDGVLDKSEVIEALQEISDQSGLPALDEFVDKFLR